jgi:hypothetical protein
MNYKALSVICWIVWVGFLGFMILDSAKVLGLQDIGFVESLKTSNLARGMFTDIGILSTIIAAWIAFGTKQKYRWIFAVITILIGSLAALPFLAIYFGEKSQGIDLI